MADEVKQFDPNKVERYFGASDGYEVVKAEDYDKVVALLQQTFCVPDMLNETPAPWPHWDDNPALSTSTLFRPDLLERMLHASPGAALAELADEVDNERVKLFASSVYGNGMHGGNRVVFDVRFSIEVISK